MGILREPVDCGLCGEGEETASHIIFECDALESRRHRTFGEENTVSDSLKKLNCSFALQTSVTIQMLQMLYELETVGIIYSLKI